VCGKESGEGRSGMPRPPAWVGRRINVGRATEASTETQRTNGTQRKEADANASRCREVSEQSARDVVPRDKPQRTRNTTQ